MTTVLYVEDNADNVILVSRICEALGHTLLVATNGLDGVAKAEAHRPNLILLDINLPDLDGYDVAQQIRASKNIRATPIIAVTANALKGDMDKALAAGCNDYISKPVNIAELRRKMAAFLPSKA